MSPAVSALGHCDVISTGEDVPDQLLRLRHDFLYKVDVCTD
jgi:hypothetical protein